MNLLHGRWKPRVALLAAGAVTGEAERARVQRHLDQCAACAAELVALRATLDTLAGDPVRTAEPPLPLPALRTRVFARLEEAERPRPSRALLGWAAGAAVAAALVIAVLWPRGSQGPVPPAGPASVPTAVAGVSEIPDEFVRHLERSVAREQAARYLDEAGDVLVTVAARPRRCRKGEERVDIGEEAQRSRDLLARRSLLDVDSSAVASARPLLDDVEQALREVASLEACARKHDLQSINRLVERRRLLLKIDLTTRELQG
jgi:hypothetical protein